MKDLIGGGEGSRGRGADPGRETMAFFMAASFADTSSSIICINSRVLYSFSMFASFRQTSFRYMFWSTNIRCRLSASNRWFDVVNPVLLHIYVRSSTSVIVDITLQGERVVVACEVLLSMRHGVSAELLLVQDGANAVNPEKIQGVTMPYG